MPVSILKQQSYLIAVLQPGLTDADWTEFGDELLDKVGSFRSSGIVIDVARLDVLDSFAIRILRTIVQSCRLRGAETVIVGIQPEIAFMMVQLGWTTRLEGISTALDLEDAIVLLARTNSRGRPK